MKSRTNITLLTLLAAIWTILCLSCGKRTEEHKLSDESSPKAKLSPPDEIHTRTLKKVNLHVKVGVVMNSGDVKPVARTEFVLSTNSLANVYEEEVTANVPTPEQFCRGLDLSTNLQRLLASLNWDLFEFENCLKGRSQRRLDMGEILETPELKKAYDAAYNFLKSGGDRFEDMVNAMSNYPSIHPTLYVTSAELPSRARDSIYSFLDDGIRQLSTRYSVTAGRGSAAAFLLAQRRVSKENLTIGITSLTGEIVFRDIPVGNYYISNIEYKNIGESSILWDYPVELSEAGDKSIELANDNAWRIGGARD